MNRTLIKWHRRIGITSALFVLVLSVTGIFLLLTVPLRLNQIKFDNPLISKIYHSSPPNNIVGFAVGGQWVVMVEGLVYVGEADPIPLTPPLVGAIIQDNGLIVFSNGAESIITLRDGTLVERIIDHNFTMQTALPLPNHIKAEVLTRYQGSGVAASRVLLDIHTGSIFGKIGPWIMGLAGVLLVLLSLSGLVMWSNPGRRKRKRTKSV